MSISTTYTCDRCGTTLTAMIRNGIPDRFWEVAVTYKHYGENLSSPAGKIFVCHSCLQSLGVVRTEASAKALPPPPSVEDLIREIIQRCSE
jgi:hypothetical protein